jgi:hypothetical protein
VGNESGIARNLAIMTGSAQDLDRLDSDVRHHVERIWPEVVKWNHRLTQNYVPEPGSSLAADDQKVPGMSVSHMAWISLATGSQHLMCTMRYLSEFGPVVMSLQSMLRTAIWGGAQAVWLLAPGDGDERVKRTKPVHYYSQLNYRKWLNTFDPAHPSTKDPQTLQRAKAVVSEQLDVIGKESKIDQTDIVKKVAALVYPERSDAIIESEQAWRTLGAIAHALPWELKTRATGETIARDAGQVTTRITARWAELGGDLGYAHEFLRRGWALLDERSIAPNPGHA